jgi:hypothetical protein
VIVSCFYPSHLATDRGVTRLSGIRVRTESSNDAPVQGRTTALCLLPPAPRTPAARCAGWLQALSPEPNSTRTLHRQARPAPPHAVLRPAAPIWRPHAHGAVSVQSLVSSHSHRLASEAPREAADLDPQACAVRFIGALSPAGAFDKRAPRHVSGPSFPQRACKSYAAKLVTGWEKEGGVSVAV